jgi:hypothetical protein
MQPRCDDNAITLAYVFRSRANRFDCTYEFVTENGANFRFVGWWYSEDVQISTAQAARFDSQKHIVGILDLGRLSFLHFEPSLAHKNRHNHDSGHFKNSLGP